MTRSVPTVGRRMPGSTRTALVLETLIAALPVPSASVGPRDVGWGDVGSGGDPVTVLDCGGGSGAYAVPLALAGCEVTVVDISADALTTLRRRAEEHGVSDRVHAVNADVERLSDPAAESGVTEADLVLAHGIVGAVEQVEPTLAALVALTRTGGLLSVLVDNPVAGVVSRALAGDTQLALAELRALDDTRTRSGPDLIESVLRVAGLSIESRRGIGAFTDLVPGATRDSPAALDALAELDALAADRAPFAQLAGRVHLLARRPRIRDPHGSRPRTGDGPGAGHGA